MVLQRTNGLAYFDSSLMTQKKFYNVGTRLPVSKNSGSSSPGKLS